VEDEVHRAYRMPGEMRNENKILVGKLERRDYS
jgi:hypothetical protein